MNIQLNSISDTRKSLVVTLDKAEVDAEHQAVVNEVSQQARIPGFRPGKAPAAMVTKRFGKEITEERIIQEYKMKDGIPLPKKVLVKHDGKDFLKAEAVDFTFLESIDDNEFKK